MPTIALDISSETNSLGTNVRLSSKDKKFNVILAENLEFDPLQNTKPALNSSYFFRSPNIKNYDWAEMLNTLGRMDEAFTLTAELDRQKGYEDVVTAWIRFEDESDAAMFAWANVENWQKWSDIQEDEYRKDKKKSKKKLKINDDGTVTVNVTVTKLGN